MLDDEPRAAKEVAQRYQAEFKEARAVHAKLLETLGPELKAPVGMDTRVVWTVVALTMKAIKTFRGIEVLAEKGFGHEALMLVRGLLETTAAVAWILAEDSKTRAAVHAAYTLRAFQKGINGWKAEPSLSSPENLASEAAIAADLAELQAELPEGTNLENHWSGVSLHHVMSKLGGNALYQTVYRHTSWVLHSSDVPDHLLLDGGALKADMTLSTQYVGMALHTASILVWTLTEEINERFRIGADLSAAKPRGL